MDASTAVYRQSLLGSLNGHYLMLPTVPVYKRGKFLGHYWMFFPFSIHKFVLSFLLRILANTELGVSKVLNGF